MQIQKLLSPTRSLAQVDATSKKRALELLATSIADEFPELDAETIFLNLNHRERLGSTGIGFGVAIPHARVEGCQAVIGALLTLAQPIDFDAIDGRPVDIIFAMLVPEGSHDEHLQNLANIAGALNSDSYRAQLRQASDSDALFNAAQFN